MVSQIPSIVALPCRAILTRSILESDSDSDIESYGNRGHKLKRRARFSRKGQLVPAEGPSAYKEVFKHGEFSSFAQTDMSIADR